MSSGEHLANWGDWLVTVIDVTKLLANDLRNKGCALKDAGTAHRDRRNEVAGHVVSTDNKQRHSTSPIQEIWDPIPNRLAPPTLAWLFPQQLNY